MTTMPMTILPMALEAYLAAVGADPECGFVGPQFTRLHATSIRDDRDDFVHVARQRHRIADARTGDADVRALR
jgi:hypothetical protein